MNLGEMSHTTGLAGENGEYACDHYAIQTSERVVVARAGYRPTARVPVCRSDSLVVFVFCTQCCNAPFIVELFDVLEIELKNAIGLGLLSRMRREIHEGIKEKAIIDIPEASGVSAHPKPCTEPHYRNV